MDSISAPASSPSHPDTTGQFARPKRTPHFAGVVRALVRRGLEGAGVLAAAGDLVALGVLGGLPGPYTGNVQCTLGVPASNLHRAQQASSMYVVLRDACKGAPTRFFTASTTGVAISFASSVTSFFMLFNAPGILLASSCHAKQCVASAFRRVAASVRLE